MGLRAGDLLSPFKIPPASLSISKGEGDGGEDNESIKVKDRSPELGTTFTTYSHPNVLTA